MLITNGQVTYDETIFLSNSFANYSKPTLFKEEEVNGNEDP